MGLILPAIGVGVVALDSRGILLVRRGREPGKGRWAVPGGRLDPGEGLRAAAAREAREETGLTMNIGEVAWQGEVRSEGPGGPFRYSVIDFAATVVSGLLRPAGDVTDARWVPMEDVPSLDLVPSMHSLLEVIR